MQVEIITKKGLYKVVARGRENRTFRLAARSLYSTGTGHGHARDTELVRVGHGTVSKKILVYIEIDIHICKVKKQPKGLIYISFIYYINIGLMFWQF
jgi:hypothetical protein